MHGFNTLRFQVTPDGGGMAADAGLTPAGVDDGMPEPEPQIDNGAALEEQLSQLQERYEEQNQMLQQLAPFAEYMQNVPGSQQPDNGVPTMPTDNFDPNYPQQMEAYLEYRDQQRLGPYQEIMQNQRQEQLNGAAMDMIHDTIQRNGELLSPQYEEGQTGLGNDQMILEVAKSISGEYVAKYGEGVRADEAAIDAAYHQVKTYQDSLLAAADARAANQVATLRQAPREPGSSGVAAQPAVTTVPGGWGAFKARHGLE